MREGDVHQGLLGYLLVTVPVLLAQLLHMAAAHIYSIPGGGNDGAKKWCGMPPQVCREQLSGSDAFLHLAPTLQR